MVEKGSWSCKPEDLFSPCNSNSNKEQKKLASDDTSMHDHFFKSSNIDSSSSELCAKDTILGDKCLAEDDNMSQYSINHKSLSDNELSFLDTDGWLDLDNFEDFDRMVLNYDSTFGTGSLDNEDEFCWLSLPHETEGPDDDPLKSDFKFSSAEVSPPKSIPDYNMGLNDNIEGLPIVDCDKKASPFDKQLRSEMDVDLDAVHTSLSTFGESDMTSGITDDLMPQQKIQGQLLKQSAGKRKKSCLKDGDSDHPYAHVEQNANLKQPCGASSSGVTSQNSIHKQRSNMDSDSLGCVQIQTPPMHPDYSHTSNYTSLLPASSGSRSEHNGYPSPSFKDSSNASNTESFQNHPLETAALKTNLRNDAKLMSKGFKRENMQNPMPFKSPGSAQKVGCQSENVNEGHSEGGEVSIGFSPETESSNMQESSSMSSAPDETSLEAANFRQLQQVLDQLDVKIKLCIRDSLYRLAKSADQRHIDANVSGLMGDDVEACKGVDANRCTGFVNIETTTNPIDRSIAHLLFHRPSESSMLPHSDTLPLKSAPMIHGSGNNPPIFAEKQVCHEESSARVENKS
ncbi:hypothetical protein TSUD_66170 [Trifolium subterraneum]|uniref:Protein LNK1 n=1 Tax=Trifolium subterraneum TaxID=3900 RepID=A0A2Z6MP74_TRISU|nr:hypothetical protein TSUD_66170 [Trifolium subterraneum]